MSGDTNQTASKPDETPEGKPLGELVRTLSLVFEENRRLRAESATLSRELAVVKSDSEAARKSRLAALNLMEDAIAARRAQQRENEERQRVEAELRIANQHKDEFLATLAHELRNPLAPIRNSLAILRLNCADNEAARRVHEMLERQVNHTVRLVDDLLEVSRITRGRIELRKEKITLGAVVQSALELSKPLIEGGRHHLAIELPREILTLWADPVRISQVLANLLNNAAKYTEDGGQIWLTARREGANVVISVRDRGLGIPQEMLSKIFDMFTQVEHTLPRGKGGLGIGLTLVKSLVEEHGGTVAARSEGIGKGSEFVIALPLASVEPSLPEPAPRDELHPNKQGGRILVVDDNEDAAESLAMLLQLSGFEAATANSGQAALDILDSYQPTSILMDVGMPDMDGNEVARRIRAQPKFGNIALVALTGWGQEDDRRRCREAGFDHHLVKPVEFGVLKDLLAIIPPFRTEQGS